MDGLAHTFVLPARLAHLAAPAPSLSAEFDGLLDEFLEVHGQNQEAREGNVPYAAPRVSQVRAEMEAYGFDDSDAAVAVQKAHEALRRAEAEEAAREAEEAEEDGEPRAARDPIPAHYQPQERERWDCESVLR